MILRTPPLRKRRAESPSQEDNNNDSIQSPSFSRQLLVYEDLQAPDYAHDHSLPVTSDQMLCTYQCRQMVKSEFFDALSSAEKQAHDYHSKFEALRKDFEKSESERKKLRDKLLNTEQELAGARGREHILQEQLRKEVDLSEEQLRKQIHAYNELEIKFQNEMDLRKNAESSAAKAEEKASILEEKLETVSESINREKGRLQTDLQMKSDTKLSVSRISADLERVEYRAKTAEKESALLKERLEELKEQLDKCMQEKHDLQKKLSTDSLEAPSKDDSLLVKHLRDELRKYESEVREAKKLKASHEDIELLKEKLREERSRRERAELDLLKLSDLKSNMKNLEDELSTWKSVIKELPGVSSVDDILSEFAALQKEVIDGMTSASQTQEKVIEVQVALDKAILDKQNAETEATMVKEKAESCKAEIKRLELMLGLTSEEKDRLKDVVKDLKEHKNLEGVTGLVSGTINRELEISLDKKENYIRQLENSLSEIKEINSRQHNEIWLLNERLTSEARRVKMLEREGDRLRSEISLLESKLGHGDFSSANTKVLRMVNTLGVETEAKQTIEALQNELQMAKEKLLAVEELKKQSPDAGTHVVSYVAGKIKQLKEQIATLEKREERYKTVFAERISVFRRACCELFGYKDKDPKHQNGLTQMEYQLAY